MTDVDMKWLTPSHLELAYKGRPSVTFQAIKCGGIDITTRDDSASAEANPPPAAKNDKSGN